MQNMRVSEEEQKLLAAVDHTLLAPTATWEQIRTLLQEAEAFHVASACIPPKYVEKAADYLAGRLPICTVIGFPNGYTTSAAKVFEAKEAIAGGAKEIDMVICLGDVKAQAFGRIKDEISWLREVCGENVLKVIIETCLLTEKEKRMMCEVVTDAKADFIKTSTGFSTGGAVIEDICLFKKHIGPDVRIKAAGGITTLADARSFLQAGASRLGTSRIVPLFANAGAIGK